MTVKELKEKLEQFPDNCIIMVPNIEWTPDANMSPYVAAHDVFRGVNKADGCVFIDDDDMSED